MLIAIAVMAFALCAVSRAGSGWWYYARGWWDAEQELWRGTATIYGNCGVAFSLGDKCRVDQETGLPILGVIGCVLYAADLQRTKGHNDHINQYIKWHGLPKNTFKPWENVLFNLKLWYDDETTDDEPKPLIPGGPALCSPDGRNSVRLLTGVNNDGSSSQMLKVVIADGDVVLDEWFFFNECRSDLLWGPERSRLVIVRSVSEKDERFIAYDLKSGSKLREESWYDGTYTGGVHEIRIPTRARGTGRAYGDLLLPLMAAESQGRAPSTADPFDPDPEK
jgi:hypothetical protein